MIKSYLYKDRLADDANLRNALKHYDPIEPETGAALAILERKIMARADALGNESVSWSASLFSILFQQGFTARAAAFASFLILASGFLAGHVFYDAENVTPVMSTLSFAALADDTAEQFLPATDESWGENDDNAK